MSKKPKHHKQTMPPEMPVPKLGKPKPLPGPEKPKRQIDWAKIKHDWMTTGLSLMDLSSKYDIPYFEIRARYNMGRWYTEVGDLEKTTDKKLGELRAAKAERTAHHVALMDEQVLALSQRALDKIEKAFEVMQDPQTKEDITTIISLMQDAATAVRSVHTNARLSGGKPTEIMRHDIYATPDEVARLEKELGFIRNKPSTTKSKPGTVAGSKPPQNT